LGLPFIIAKNENIGGGLLSNEVLESFWVNFLRIDIEIVADRKDVFSDAVVFVKDEFIEGNRVDRNRWLVD